MFEPVVCKLDENHTRVVRDVFLYNIVCVTENYGQSGIQAFRELAERANICIAKEDSVLSNAEDEVFERVVRKLDQDQNARVVVCFCEGMTVRGLLAATLRLNLTGRFIFLGRLVSC